MDRLSRHFAKSLTIKDRRSWCQDIELVGKKTFKIIIDAEAARQKRIKQAMDRVKRLDKNYCQISGEKKTIETPNVTIVAHHIYDKQNHKHLEDSLDNLITLSGRVHVDFHAWNGNSKESCAPDDLINFVQKFYPDNYQVIHRLNQVKQKLNIG